MTNVKIEYTACISGENIYSITVGQPGNNIHSTDTYLSQRKYAFATCFLLFLFFKDCFIFICISFEGIFHCISGILIVKNVGYY